MMSDNPTDYKELARLLAQHLEDYDRVKQGYLKRETWEARRRVLLTRAEEKGIEVIPF